MDFALGQERGTHTLRLWSRVTTPLPQCSEGAWGGVYVFCIQKTHLALGYILWSLVFGLWSLVSGLWSLVSGLWSLVSGLWSLVSGLWSLVFGLWSLVFGLWSLVSGLWSLVSIAPSISFFFFQYNRMRQLDKSSKVQFTNVHLWRKYNSKTLEMSKA